MKKEYAVGIKIINCFYVEAESREDAEQMVREYDPYDTLKDCDFNVEYVDPTNGEIAWKIKADEVDWNKLVHNSDSNDFIDNADMMLDFHTLSKEEFLRTYSYITEREYEETKRKTNK